MHPTDNPIWQALTTRQAHLGESCGNARRFDPEVSLLSAFAPPGDEGYDSLARLAVGNAPVGIFLDTPYDPRPGWDYLGGAELVRMIRENGAPAPDSATLPIVELGANDVPDMLALTDLTKPGPFSRRTRELGYYVGIRQHGKLVAMAGERLKLPGYTEVSAVCTHPEHLGKGYARALMGEVMQGIRHRGETPFLHDRADNARAIALYEHMGFNVRWRGHYAILRKAG